MITLVPVLDIVTAYPVPFPGFTSGRKGYAKASVFRVGDRIVAVMTDEERELSSLPHDGNRLYLTNSVEHFASYLLWTLRNQQDWRLKPDDLTFVQYLPPVEGYKGAYSLVEFQEVRELPGSWGWRFGKPVWKDFMEVERRTESTDEEAALKALQLVKGEADG